MSESKCNWQNWSSCKEARGIRLCSAPKMACEHRIAEPENRPMCPKCGKVLVDCMDSIDKYVCVTSYCDYTQPDSDQRPPMPTARDGYHAGEWRLPKRGEWYFKGDGLLQAISDHGDLPLDVPYWIAVPDAKPEPDKPDSCPYCGIKKDGRSLACHIQACVKRNQPLIATPDAKPAKSCDNCLRNGSSCTHQEMPKGKVCDGWRGRVEDEKASGPVVRYWRHGDYFTKTIDGVPVEAIDCGVVKRPLKTDVPCGHCVPSDAAEYEAAKQPVKTVEPLDPINLLPYNDAGLISHSLMSVAMNVVIHRLNAITERLAKVEGKVNG